MKLIIIDNCVGTGSVSGGGVIRITTDHISVLGKINADGNQVGRRSQEWYGGGSGGSILIDTKEFIGNGRISSNGGDGHRSG